MTDIVIIGASIAGLAAAQQVARAGHDVLVLDRRPGPEQDAPPAALAFDALWERAPGLLSAEAARYDEVRLRAGRRTARIRASSRLYDRARLDSTLATIAAKAGAKIQWAATDLTIDQTRRVRWHGGSAFPKILLLADGPEGWARHFFQNLQDPAEMRFGQAWRLPDVLDEPATLDIAFSSALDGGRVQLNPTRNETIVWAFRRGRPPTRRETLAAHPLLRGRPATDLAPMGPARPDPVFALPGTISGDGVLAAGGAGGQGGLELGFLAGSAAGEAAASAISAGRTDAKSLHGAYERPWKQRWVPGLERFRVAYNRFTSMNATEQEAVLLPWEKDGLDLHDVVVPSRKPGIGRSVAAFKVGLRNARRMRALWRTYRQLKV